MEMTPESARLLSLAIAAVLIIVLWAFAALASVMVGNWKSIRNWANVWFVWPSAGLLLVWAAALVTSSI